MLEENNDDFVEKMNHHIESESDEKKTTKYNVLLLGSTGYVGKHIIEELKKRKHFKIRALSRAASADIVKDLVDEVYIGDATDDTSIPNICADIDIVISALGVRKGDSKSNFWNVDYQANLNVVNRALATDSVKLFIFLSYLHGDKDIVRKSIPLIDARERVIDVLKENERYNKRKLQYIVIRPTLLYGDLGDLFDKVLQGYNYVPGTGNQKINPIDGKDLATFLCDKIEKYNEISQGKEFEIGGQETYTITELLGIAHKVARKDTYKATHVPNPLLNIASIAIKPFNNNLSNLLNLIHTMNLDIIANPYGNVSLTDYFTQIYNGKPSKSHVGYTEVIIHSGSFMELSFTCNSSNLNSTLHWEFFTEKKDIGLIVYYCNSETDAQKETLTKIRANSHLDKINGQITFNKIGIFNVRFDNSYSKFTKKTLYYKMSIKS